MMLAPIALFAYNRPNHLRQTVEALRAARQARLSRLFVFCDGAKRSQDRDAVEQVRYYARTIEGFASVTVVEWERNLGLAVSITEGVTNLCVEHGCVIVMEDDLLVGPGFLEFMNRSLERYTDEEKVMQVSGYMYPGEFGRPRDTLFLPMTSCWGWATWKRAWDRYDSTMAGYDVLRHNQALRRRFDVNGAYDYSGMLKRQAAGAIDSWGIRWYLSVFLLEGLVLYPSRSMVRNIGVDGSGTHGGHVALQQELAADSELPIRFPERLQIDEAVLARLAYDFRSMQGGLLTRLIRRFVA